MTDHPFDNLARTLALGDSRRGVLRTIGGAVLGYVIAGQPRLAWAQANTANSQQKANHFSARQRVLALVFGTGWCGTGWVAKGRIVAVLNST
jgi:hypothetical protein